MRTMLILGLLLAGCGGGVGRFPGAYSASATVSRTTAAGTDVGNTMGTITIVQGVEEDEIFTTGDLCDAMPAVVSGSTATYKQNWGCSVDGYKFTLTKGGVTLDSAPFRQDVISGSSAGTFTFADSSGSHYSGTFTIEWRGSRK